MEEEEVKKVKKSASSLSFLLQGLEEIDLDSGPFCLCRFRFAVVPAGPTPEELARQKRLAIIAQYGMVEDGQGGYGVEGGPGPGDEGYVGGRGKGPDLDGVSVDMLEAELKRMGLKKKQKKKFKEEDGEFFSLSLFVALSAD